MRLRHDCYYAVEWEGGSLPEGLRGPWALVVVEGLRAQGVRGVPRRVPDPERGPGPEVVHLAADDRLSACGGHGVRAWRYADVTCARCKERMPRRAR